MTAVTRSIDGEPVTTKLAMKMEDSMQAFAVRAACFIGELDVPYSEEFDGHDFGATHVIAYVGDEPVGAVRVRWFQSFAMPERLAVIQRFRGHNIGQLLLERCRQLAETRGNRTNAAKLLEISHRALLYKIKDFGIDADEVGREARNEVAAEIRVPGAGPF